MNGETPRLYLFPHAGGSATFYVPFARTFRTGVPRVAVSYPARRGNHDLAAFTSIVELADQMWGKLPAADRAASGVCLFGHSMGALVAFEVARRFEAAGNPVAALFVSACAAPGRVGYDHVDDTDAGLLAAVAEFTGVDAAMLADEAFAATILPTLRGLKAIQNYRAPEGATISAPIHAYLGDADDVATPDKVGAWAERTTGQWSMRVFPGHHFYLSDQLRPLVDDIETRMWAACGREVPAGR